MIFSTLTDKLTQTDYNIQIQNLEVSDNHWRSTTNIARLVAELELVVIKDKGFEGIDFISWLLELNQQNPRIEEINFFTDPAFPHTLICVCVSDLPTFKAQSFLERHISIGFKKSKLVLLIVDVTLKEWYNQSLTLPRQWRYLDQMSNKYDKYKRLFLV